MINLYTLIFYEFFINTDTRLGHINQIYKVKNMLLHYKGYAEQLYNCVNFIEQKANSIIGELKIRTPLIRIITFHAHI